MANLICLLIVILGLAECGVNIPVTVKPPRNTQANPVDSKPESVTLLEGQWVATDHSTIDLTQFRSKATILVFAQDTCSVCRKESLAIRASLADPTAAPNRVNLFTVLVGSPLEDAEDWKGSLKIPWKVGADAKSDLFRKFCVTPTVPCLLVQLPERGIVFVKNGEVSLSELTTLTGPWEGS